ncbi:hypothetical protein J5N97_025615 [Dioscorea zingiberensis]|uniref:Uncharacterized protein n=1 Tax=Dioscorea zingiberensis TaxID=325984 RepID=A0A9D5C0M8_9LILI|nr:hypothetical protein J5N97_025615 [Dioscorea zingiberensis]
MAPPQTPQFAPRNPRKGKSKKKQLQDKGPLPPSPRPAHPPPPEQRLPAPPSILFPRYSSATSTPLPPPSMPKKRFLRRALPFLVAATAAAYYFRGMSKKEATEKVEGIEAEASSVSSRERIEDS